MKILHSYSKHHYDPKEDKILYGHSVGVEAQIFYHVLREFGEVDYIDSTEIIRGKTYDLLLSLPRNFGSLTRFNKISKSICYLNCAAPGYLKQVLREEATRLGCKVSDCYAPANFYHADHYLVLGKDFNRTQYLRAGIPVEKMTDIAYGMEAIPFKPRDKNKRPIFLHIATTLGLRKGFWWVIEDFKKANLDAELWCIGQVQNERFWVDYAKEAEKDPRITIFGWINCHDQKYTELIHKADFYILPSWGEGQAGTTMEATAGGCIPIVSKESGFPHYPIAEYIRGETKQWEQAYGLSNEEFREKQLEMQGLLKTEYNNEKFKEIARKVVAMVSKK